MGDRECHLRGQENKIGKQNAPRHALPLVGEDKERKEKNDLKITNLILGTNFVCYWISLHLYFIDDMYL